MEKAADDYVLSLVRGDVAFRIQRRLGLIPDDSLGIGRRALFWSLLSWLPVMAWALYAGRMGPSSSDDSLLAHFSVLTRCLVSIPLLILGEAPAHATTMRLLPHFVTSGLIPEKEIPKLRETLSTVARLRDATLPWVAFVGAALALSTVAELAQRSHEVAWGSAVPGDPTAGLGFGALWFLYVARPINLALVAAWLWRSVLLSILLLRISRLDLSLVPTHPDKAAGLGFLEGLPKIFAPLVLALGAVLASRWAHEIVYHGVHVKQLYPQMGAFVAVAIILFCVPMLFFAPLLLATKKRALLEYAALVGQHGRLVRQRWILHEKVGDDAVLNAPELGPIADTGPAYDAVAAMRPAPLGKASVVPLVLAAVLPLIPVVALEIPIGQIFAALAKALI